MVIKTSAERKLVGSVVVSLAINIFLLGMVLLSLDRGEAERTRKIAWTGYNSGYQEAVLHQLGRHDDALRLMNDFANKWGEPMVTGIVDANTL